MGESRESFDRQSAGAVAKKRVRVGKLSTKNRFLFCFFKLRLFNDSDKGKATKKTGKSAECNKRRQE